MMDRCYLLVEGQTEETFANKLLVPHLYSRGFHSVSVTIVATKRLAGGGKYSGGVSKWAKLRHDIELLARDHSALVTTLIDFYRFPSDAPGMNELQPGWGQRRKVAHLEHALGSSIGARNFLPHVTLHEIETLVYADPDVAAAHFGDQRIAVGMRADLQQCGEPEMVDDGPDTAPSKRIAGHRSDYVKTSDGPAILADIGLPAIRAACPHFDEWLAAVEATAPGS